MKKFIYSIIIFSTVLIFTSDIYTRNNKNNAAVNCIMEYTYFGPKLSSSFIQPYGVFSYDNGFYAAGYNSLSFISRTGKVKWVLDRAGSGRGKFQMAQSVNFDSKRNIYVLDNLQKKIIIYNKSGKFLKEVHHNATYPQSFAVTSDSRIFIPDTSKGFLLVYNNKGREINNIKFKSGELVAVSGSGGKLKVLLSRNNSYHIAYYNSNGKMIRSRDLKFWFSKYVISKFDVDSRGNFYGIDISKNLIMKVDFNSNIVWSVEKITGSTKKYFNSPYDISVSRNGKDIYVVDMQNKRILRFKEFKNKLVAGNEAGYMKLAKKYMKSDKDRYLFCLNMSLNSNPDYIPALLSKGKYYMKEGLHSQSVDIFHKVIEIDRNNKSGKVLLKKSKLALYGDRAKNASSRFRTVLKNTGPESSKQYYHEAVKNYEMALKLNPNDKKLKAEYNKIKLEYARVSGEGGLPPIEIDSIKFSEVFAAMYKYYNNNPIGSLVIENKTGMKIDKIYVELRIKDYMDYPTESRSFRNFANNTKKNIKMFAVFNNKILTVSEDTPINARINVIYTVQGKKYNVSKNKSLNLYNRNAMIWDRTEKLASFITPKDPVVKVFARTVVQMFRHSRLKFMNKQLQSAIQLYDTLGTYGMTYVKDPKTPFAKFSKLKNSVDFIQYPRETLRFKTGDCDDLTVMFCSLLENLGIETALVTVPGHIFMMLNTEVPAAKISSIVSDKKKIIIRNGKVWIPVEATLMGRNFDTAWTSAARQYNKYYKSNSAEIIQSKDAWRDFAPVTLEDIRWEPKIPDTDLVNRLYYSDINKIINSELSKKISKLKKKLSKDKKNPKIHNSIGVAYARYGKYDKAASYFTKAKDLDKNYFSPYNNLGNLYLMKKKHSEALKYFKKASALKPGNAYVHINLSMIYRKMNKPGMSKKSFNTAVKLNSKLREQYNYLISDQGLKASDQDDLDNLIWTR